MPELPEVETVARLVRPKLVGRTIEDVSVGWVRTLGGLSKPKFREAVVGARISSVWRRAKYILFDLERDGEQSGWLCGHLRMTGRFHVEPRGWDAGPHVRVALHLDGGRDFHFIDVRKFGRLSYVTEIESLLQRLGPEPLEEEFTLDWFRAALKRRRRQLKPLLLDQSFLSGLGNIYVDEALFKAGLHPERLSASLRGDQPRKLHTAIRSTLEAAIEREGSSFDTFYRTPEGQPGSYQHQFLVYGRQGQACKRCKSKIAKIVVGQRGTHLCRRCQPVPRASATAN